MKRRMFFGVLAAAFVPSSKPIRTHWNLREALVTNEQGLRRLARAVGRHTRINIDHIPSMLKPGELVLSEHHQLVLWDILKSR